MIASRRFAILPLILLAMGLAACGSSATPAASTPAVTVVTLKPETVTLTRELPGRTTPYLVAEVRPQVTGIVRDQLFAEGSVIEAGQALYQLEDATQRAAYNSAQAMLTRAKVALEVARNNATRSTELTKTGAISKQEAENAVALLHQAEADVGVARAQLESAEVMLNYARISSPIGGRIGKSSVTKGALVTANQDMPLATIQQLDPIYVDLTQSATELLELRRETAAGRLTDTSDVPVAILLEDGSRYPNDGKLKFADVTVDETTGSFALRIVVPNPDNLLLPGMYVRAALSNGERQNALLVPQQGITRDPKGNANAMVVAADNTVQPRPVQVSRTIGDKWLVDAGLQAGDRVIIEGLQKIKPGMPVQATEFAPPAGPDSDQPPANPAMGDSTPASPAAKQG
jgi:membrane fusion protein (multidrug efflux system)